MIPQTDIGSSQNVQSHKYLIGAHQIHTRADTATKSKYNAMFDNLNLQK